MEAMLLPNEGLESNDIYKSTHHFWWHREQIV
jgi:hypothetical protein